MEDLEIIAYQIQDVPEFILEPASGQRPWMDATPNRFAYRCLPLVIANQFGWILRCPLTFEVYWNGASAPGQGLVFNWAERDAHLGRFVSDHFGDGIMTFSVPYLFRTPPGYGMLVRGPTNAWVTNAHPLDGFVETDWLEASFTMNWKLVEPFKVVRFEAGFPICHLLPYPRQLLESFTTRKMPLAENPELHQRHNEWGRSRHQFNHDPERKPQDWQKHYFQGKNMGGERAEGHQTRLNLKPFD